MHSFPSLEPAVVSGGAFVMERMLDRTGELLVGVGDAVEPDTVVARTGNVDRQVTLYAATELGLSSDSLKKYLAKSIGSTVKTGEVLARVRRGLRTVVVRSPLDGVLQSADDASGTLVLSTSMGPQELRALVRGEVEQVVHNRGAVLRSSGTRIYGILGFGGDALGELVVGIDRHDRELTPDNVASAWQGKIVLAGMTLGVPALTRLKEVGVAGVIVGSLSESDIRRFLSPSGADRFGAAAHFWSAAHGDGLFARPELEVPFVIIATEGFGRRPMAEPLFDELRRYEGQQVSVTAATSVGQTLSRPEIYFTSGADDSAERATDTLAIGRQVRLVDPSQVGQVGVCISVVYSSVAATGLARDVVRVQLGTEERVVPVANVEALV